MNSHDLALTDPNTAQMAIDDRRREARKEPSQVVLPGTVETIRIEHGAAQTTYVIKGADAYTDCALLEYCRYTEYFGGRVERFSDGVARVVVYID